MKKDLQEVSGEDKNTIKSLIDVQHMTNTMTPTQTAKHDKHFQHRE